MSFKSKYTGALIEALLDNANYIQDMLLPKIEGYVTSIELKDGKITVTVQKELTSENIKYLDKPLEDVINELIERSGLLDKVVANSLNVVYNKFNEYVPKSGGLFKGNIGADKFIKTGSNNREVLLGSGEAKEVFDNSGKIKSDCLPSYVDDVLEFASLSAFPTLGESGKIYVAADTGLTYRWSGSTYISISSKPDWGVGDSNNPNYIKNRTHYLDNLNPLNTNYEGLSECRVTSCSDSYAEFCMGVIAYSNRTALKHGDKYYVELYGYETILTYDEPNEKLVDPNDKVCIYSPTISSGILRGLLDLNAPELASLVGMNDLLRIYICEFDGVRELNEIYIPTKIKNQINNNNSNISTNTSNIQKLINNQNLSSKYFYIDTGTTSGYITNPNALLLYSNDGIDWSSVSKGSKVYIKGRKYIRYNKTFSGSYSLGTFKADVYFTIGGNILSLINSSSNNYNVGTSFRSLFYGCTYLTSAKDLIIHKDIVMEENAFWETFNGCTNLQYPPKLPMLKLKKGCYMMMFFGCSALLEVPELPATTLQEQCYRYMFSGCKSIRKTTELPALSVPGGGYLGMFQNCTSLVVAPELPATYVSSYGYNAMFSGCSSLIKGPSVLPASYVNSDGQYSYMFEGCNLKESPIILAKSIVGDHSSMVEMFRNNSQLSKVTILATEIDTENDNLNDWLAGTSLHGTFIKHPDATSWPTSTSGRPSGWKVINYYPLEEIDNVKKEITTTKYDLERLIDKVEAKAVLSDWAVNSEIDNAYIKNRTHYLKRIKYIGKSFKLLWEGGISVSTGHATDISGKEYIYLDGECFGISDYTNEWLSIFEENKIYRIGITTDAIGYDEEIYPDHNHELGWDDYDLITGKFQKIIHPHTGKEIFILGDLNNAFISGSNVTGCDYAFFPNLNSPEKFILQWIEYGGDSYFSLVGDCYISEELERLGGGHSIGAHVVIEEVTDYDIEYEYKQLDINYIPTVNTLDESTDKVPTSKAVYNKITEVASQARYTSNIEDKTLTMPNAVGGIAKGTKVSAIEGKTYNEIFDDLLFPTVNPTFTAPSSTIALRDKNASVLEIGVQGPSISDFTTSFNAGAINLNGVKQNNRAGTLDTDSSFIYIDGDATDVLTKNPYEFNVGNNTFTYRAYYAAGPLPKDNKGNNYSTPLATGYVDSKAVTVSGTYPWYASTSTATSNNPVVKQVLVAWSDTVGSMSTGQFTLQPSGTLPQVFKLPRQLKTLQMLNAVSGVMDTIGTSDYTETTEVITIGSIEVTYYVYTYNGSTRGEVTLLAKF